MEDLEAEAHPGDRGPGGALRHGTRCACCGCCATPPASASPSTAAAWEEILAKGDLIRTCPPARVRDELLKDFHSGAAQPFFKLMLDSKLFYAIFPAWAGRLGASGEGRLLELIGRLDLLVQNGYPLSDSLLWAVFLTAFLEPELQPREFKELREFIQEKIKAALGGIEFPRARQDEVSQMLALEAAGGAAPGQGPAHPGPPDPADPVPRHLAAASIQDRAGGGTAGTL